MARRNSRSVSEAIIRLSGSPRYLGTIDFTATSKTNAEATTAFNTAAPRLGGKVLLIQPDQDCYILPVSTSTGTVTSTNGVKLTSGERVQITMDDIDPTSISGEAYQWLACLRVSASGNLKVWELV